MGTFYGSIHARAATVDRALPVLREAARLRGVSFYMRPTAAWLAIYPSDGGQDMRVSADVAAALDLHVVHVLLHDSDVVAYTVYAGSRKLDEFTSNPDYFGPASTADRARARGRPTRFAELIGPGSSVAQVEALLEAARAAAIARADWLRPGERLDDVVEKALVEAEEQVEAARPLKARLDEWLVTRAREQLGIEEADAAALVARLAGSRDVAARRLLDEHGRELSELLRAATVSGGILRRMNRPGSMEEMFRELSRAFDLPEAHRTYEDLQGDPLPGLIHVTG